MKLLNRTALFQSGALLLIIGVWAGLFYIEMLDEVYDSLDDGLDNYKMLIIQKAKTDSTVLHKTEFAESNYAIREIGNDQALKITDRYKDTLMFMQNEEDYEPVRILTTSFEHESKYYELKIISSMVEEDDLIEDLLYAIFWLFIALIISILLINNLLFRRLWKPFYKILHNLKTFRLGSGKLPPEISSRTDEFKALNDTVQELLKHTSKVYKSQKEFIENASHELQTPLAISINKLELMAERGDLSEEEIDQVSQVLRQLERLTKMNKSLLLLSKIENSQFPDEKPVDFSELVQQVAEDLRDLADYKEVELVINTNEKWVVNMNEDLAIIFITNLIKNAIVHNRKNGKVEIEVSSNSLTISNTGDPSPLESEKLFKRFYRSHPEKGSTGLGLAIADAISTHYHFQLHYSFTDRMHIISVKFKP